MNPTPRTYNGDFANPPAALKSLFLERRWVNWKWVEGRNGKYTKPPFQPEHPESHAANDRSKTWDTSSAAIKAVLSGRANGIGFALTGSSYCAIDMDHCRDPVTWKIDAWARALLDRAPNAYVEATVSGTGLRHYWCWLRTGRTPQVQHSQHAQRRWRRSLPQGYALYHDQLPADRHMCQANKY